MLLHVREVLSPDELRRARDVLHGAPWQDGRLTAGEQSAKAKNNEQLREDCEETRLVQQLLLRGLERHAIFFSAALPKQISPPLFNRYGGASNSFGNHVDSAVRFLRDGSGRVRTDISCTLFLSAPDEYEGGELVIEDTYGEQRVKLAAGDMVLYPASSLHRVEPITRGSRWASFFWVQSMIRDDGQRRLLHDLDEAIIRARIDLADDHPSVVSLTSSYHNLIRMWAEA